MRVHLIAVGGSAMHNLALALHYNHHTVTGSDDEIYNPARDRLIKAGLFPSKMGWDENRITKDIDAIIVGMHARKNNPELKRAQKLKLKIYSYPEYLYECSKNKTRVVVAGSHGKTTTTSMIMHVLNYHQIDFDYLVGAQLDGFERMVRLSKAPLIIIEGDEYLSSPIDLRPKFLHYKPHVAIITGIAWDHINVFPTFRKYLKQFSLFAQSMNSKGRLFYYEKDPHLPKILSNKKINTKSTPYTAFDAILKKNKTVLISASGKKIPLKIFGDHNLQNLKAAYLACSEIGISEDQFFEAIKQFKGAAKRLQLLARNKNAIAYQDFAHAPSKAKATIEAFKTQFSKRQLVACLELHTFSSLNKQFLKEYQGTMEEADKAFVFFSEHTLKMKKLPPITVEEVEQAFAHHNLKVIVNDNQKLIRALKRFKWIDKNLLLMSSGTFGGLDLKQVSKDCLANK